MVSDQGDIPDRSEVEPDDNRKGQLLEELLDRGETIAHLEDGSTEELHGYDTYVFLKPKSSSYPGVVYTQNESEDEIWFFTSEIVRLEQH